MLISAPILASLLHAVRNHLTALDAPWTDLTAYLRSVYASADQLRDAMDLMQPIEQRFNLANPTNPAALTHTETSTKTGCRASISEPKRKEQNQ